MTESQAQPGVWFVYRSHYAGPLSRRVRRLAAPSILAWFQRKLEEARTAAEPHRVADKDLGGYVYGFGTVFKAAQEHDLPTPRDMEELRALLHEHLYVEGGPEHIRLDEHSVRVRTDDDEVQLAYFFFDDEAARRHPDRVAWLLHEEPRLPEGAADAPFHPPAEVEELLPDGGGEGATYACLFTHYDGQTLPGTACVLAGVRLPGLVSHLRTVIPATKPQAWSSDWLDTWPVEMRLLRALLDPQHPADRALAPALERGALFPISVLMNSGNHSRLGVGLQAAARDEFYRAAKGLKTEGDPAKSIVHASRNAALVCAHTSKSFGHQQWVLFDDRWAAAHPELAASIIHYASGWDPFGERTPPARRPEEAAAERRAMAGKPAASEAAAAEARAYRPGERFALGERVSHAKFGLGVVQRVDGKKIEVIFDDGPRLLAHDMGG